VGANYQAEIPLDISRSAFNIHNFFKLLCRYTTVAVLLLSLYNHSQNF